MARRRARARRGWLRGLVLAALAISAVAFGRSPERPAAQGKAGGEEREHGERGGQREHGEQGGQREQRERGAQREHSQKASLRVGDPAFFSALDCEQTLRPRAARTAAGGARIGTWNLRWFPRGTASGHNPDRRTDVRWLACAIASLEVDVLAVQEVVQDPEGRAALLDLCARLDALTGGRWRAELDACPGSGRQHVGLLFDARRVTVRDAGEVAGLNPGRSACDKNLRPGFGAHVRFANGQDAHVIAVHFDSGPEQRDFDNRQRSVARLGEVLGELRRRGRDADVVVLGDFNTMGCAKCAPASNAQQELDALDRQLNAVALTRLRAAGGPLCSEYYRGHAGLLDHVLVSNTRGWPSAPAEPRGPCAALACAPPPRGQPPPAFQHLSDHCPLTVNLPATPKSK